MKPNPFGRSVFGYQPSERSHTNHLFVLALVILFTAIGLPGPANAEDQFSFCGMSPPVVGSTGNLALNADPQRSKIFQWRSLDTTLGEINTGIVIATTWNYFPATAASPARLIFMGSGNGAAVSGNVIFGDYNRAVVDVVDSGRRIRYTLVGLRLNLSLQAIDRDNPANNTFAPLGTLSPVVYGGSEMSTSDRLKLTVAVNANVNIPPTNFSWLVTGPGAGFYTPPAPAPIPQVWDVGDIAANAGILTFRAIADFADGNRCAIVQDVEVGIRTDDVIVVGWINPLGVPIPIGGVSPSLLLMLPPAGPPVPSSLIGNLIVGLLSQNFILIPDVTVILPTYLSLTPLDRAYILNWLFRYGSNTDPLISVPGGDFRDPTNSRIQESKVAGFFASNTDYKLFNRLQIKFLVGPAGFKGAPTVLQNATGIGITKNPMGASAITIPILTPPLPLLFPPVIIPLPGIPALSIPSFVLPSTNFCIAMIPATTVVALPGFPIGIASTTIPGLFPGQSGPVDNLLSIFPTRVSLINDGSPDAGAIQAFNTLVTTPPPLTAPPMYWENIGSQIRFTFNGGAAPAVRLQPYPTYYEYHNGTLVKVTPQAATPLGNFAANPYPFGTVGSLALGGLVNGGRCGEASTPADPSGRIPPSGYTIP